MTTHTLIQILVVLVVAGVLVYLVNALIPMDSRFKLVVNVIIGLALFFWILNVLGLWSGPAVHR